MVPLAEFSLSSQVEDLSIAIIWLLEKRKNIRIISLGISFGAPPAMIVSELYHNVINKCILIAPVTDYKATFLYPKTKWGKDLFGYEKILQGVRNDALFIEQEYILKKNILMDMLMVDILNFIKNTNYEISIFHGECDEFVPIDTSERLASERKNIKLNRLEKTEHGLTEVGDEKFLNSISISNLEKVVAEIVNG